MNPYSCIRFMILQMHVVYIWFVVLTFLFVRKRRGVWCGHEKVIKNMAKHKTLFIVALKNSNVLIKIFVLYKYMCITRNYIIRTCNNNNPPSPSTFRFGSFIEYVIYFKIALDINFLMN